MTANDSGMSKVFPSNSDTYAREFYDSLLIEPRYIGSVAASTEVSYFGKTYPSPIMIAPFVGSPDWGRAAQKTGTIFWTAHAAAGDAAALRNMGVDFIATSKPICDPELLRQRIRTAEEQGALAFFIDIDHLFAADTGTWYLGRDGIPMGVQTPELLESYVKCSSLPIILKGVMSTADARIARESGVAAIVSSHHHGRVLWSIPPAMAVERMRRAVGPDYPIFVDCGIESGVDAFKALALGADGVLVCRHLMPFFQKGGAEAVAERLEAMRRELAAYLSMTGASCVRDIDPACLIRKSF